MKIVRIIARLNVGGPARHVAWLTAEMRHAGHDALLVAGVVPPGEADMSYFAHNLGVEPVVIPEMSREISPRDVVTIWKLYSLLRRTKPDIVHTHTAKAGTVGRIAGMFYRWLTPAALTGRPRRCRFVHTYHGHVFHSYYGRVKTRLFLFIERLLARIATDSIVVISPQQFQEIHGEFKVGRAAQFRIVPLGLDLKPFENPSSRRDAVRRELGADAVDVLVGIVGRLAEVKDHKLFLRAAAHYKVQCAKGGDTHGSMNPQVRFLIIGDGHLRAELEAEAARLGVAGDVVFLGTRPDPEFFYPALDVVALTSLNEGTPLTLIEAMANERPVIATAVGGVRDLIGEELADAPASASTRDVMGAEGFRLCAHGALVMDRDPACFAKALERLIADEDLRREMGARGAGFVRRGYSKQRLLGDITALYEDLIARDMRHAPASDERMIEAPQLKGE